MDINALVTLCNKKEYRIKALENALRLLVEAHDLPETKAELIRQGLLTQTEKE